MNAKQGLRAAEVALDGIELLAKILGAPGPAVAVLDAAQVALKTLQDGVSGATEPSVVLAHLEALHRGLVVNDDFADAELDRRFDP